MKKSLIEKEEYKEIEFIDPITKEKKTSKVKVTRYKMKHDSDIEECDEIISSIKTKISIKPLLDLDA